MMVKFPKKLIQKLQERKYGNAFRKLPQKRNLVDFTSNDYLGLAKASEIATKSHQLLQDITVAANGATGSRLLSGNHPLYERLENYLCDRYGHQAALVFNSGYDANIGFFSSVPQRTDVVFYDELIHASIRDGIQMGHAKSYKFKHNDLEDLKKAVGRIKKTSKQDLEVYIVTESVFSMDGDSPEVLALADYCTKNKLRLVVDEAHAIGVFGKGFIANFGLQEKVFAQIITFGKAMGCHGAAILGSQDLKDYLVNFARSFIYTTAMPPHTVATILTSFDYLNSGFGERAIERLNKNIKYFKALVQEFGLTDVFLPSDSAIQIAVYKSADKVKRLAQYIADSGFEVLPILAPTVSQGNERLRICLHAFNTREEMKGLITVIGKNG